jgi:FkbM family methyltransferase
MKHIAGYCVPDEDTYCEPYLLKDGGFQVAHLEQALQYVTNWTVAIDGGAHIGSWSIRMAKSFQRVISFEPARDNYECLKSNTKDYSNINARNEALGEAIGRASVQKDPTRKGNTASHYLVPGDDVPVITIDSLELPSLGLMKLDLEGSEPQALNGAKETISRCRPLVMIEVKQNLQLTEDKNPIESVHFLQQLGGRVIGNVQKDWVIAFDHRLRSRITRYLKRNILGTRLHS